MEPDEKYGYASINSLSKAIFHLPYIKRSSLKHLNEIKNIAIQAHIFHEDLISEIIEKTNNMPVKFDLFISTDSIYKKTIIENYIKNNSNANVSEVQIFQNKGRDALPLLLQLKKRIKKYKYFCHIHTNTYHLNIGDEWREYIYNNLLGSKEIISEILVDFEKNDNLGIIFPETYYKLLNLFGKQRYDSYINYMNFIMKKINKNLRITPNYFDYPVGNMFWSKVKAVYQIFELNIKKDFPNEKEQIYSSLMNGIERIWAYIAKLNVLLQYFLSFYFHFL